jgi:uncharacterized protein
MRAYTESEPIRRPATELIELPHAECIRLLALNRFGRLVVNVGAGPPLIRPVNYIFDAELESVVFRTGAGSKLHAICKGMDAAFEIDGVDDSTRTGWSVIIRGITDEVSAPAVVRRLDRLGLEPWAPGLKPHWVHVRAWTVSGRRILLPEGPGVSASYFG